MRSIARLTLASPATAEPSPWAVRSVEHRAALCRVADVLRALLGAIPRDPDGTLRADLAPADTLGALRSALDALTTAAAGGGTRTLPGPDDHRLHTTADTAKVLLTQLRALVRAQRHERDRWCELLAGTLAEAFDLCA